jgi:hypothetical protein
MSGDVQGGSTNVFNRRDRREIATEVGRAPSMSSEQREAISGSLDDNDDADFAGEHDDTSLAEQQEGGPEGVDEPDSPRTRQGMD